MRPRPSFLLAPALLARAKHDDGASDDDDSSSVSFSSSTAPPSTSSVPIESDSSTVFTTSTFIESSSGSSTATASASSSSASSPLVFDNPPSNVSTCRPATFTWEFDSNMTFPLTINATNERAVSADQQSSGGQPISLISRTLTTTVDARACIITWSAVDVPAGAYSLVATDTGEKLGLNAQSAMFSVFGSGDNSCFSNSSDTTASNTSNTSQPSASSSGSPHTLSAGAIAGTVIGVMVSVVALIFALSIPRLRRKLRSNDSESPRPGAPYQLF